MTKGNYYPINKKFTVSDYSYIPDKIASILEREFGGEMWSWDEYGKKEWRYYREEPFYRRTGEYVFDLALFPDVEIKEKAGEIVVELHGVWQEEFDDIKEYDPVFYEDVIEPLIEKY